MYYALHYALKQLTAITRATVSKRTQNRSILAAWRDTILLGISLALNGKAEKDGFAFVCDTLCVCMRALTRHGMIVKQFAAFKEDQSVIKDPLVSIN